MAGQNWSRVFCCPTRCRKAKALEFFIQQTILFLTAVAILAGIPLAVATAVGLVFSFVQAITQIQDQTLPQTAKMVAIALTFLAMGGFLIAPLFEGSAQLFDTFWQVR